MTTLFDILFDLYDDLGQLRSGVATGGSATTVVDTLLKPYGVDAFNHGTVLINDTTDDAAPKGEFGEVSAFTPSTGTLTVPTLTAAVGAGDLYGLADDSYPVDDMIRLVNRSLSRLGPWVGRDTSLTTAAGQTEYALPADCKPQRLRRVYIQGLTGNSADNRWVENYSWLPQQAASNDLRFRVQPASGLSILLVYMGDHPEMSVATDALNESVEPDLLNAELLYRALKWKARTDESNILKQWINDAAADLEEAKRKRRFVDPGKPFKSILQPDDGNRSNKYGPYMP